MEFSKIIQERRAVNFFDTEKDVSGEKLRKIIDLASFTPSGFNLQPWSLIVLRDKEAKERLKKAAMNQPKVAEAPVVLILLADKQGWKPGSKPFEKLWEKMTGSGHFAKGQRGWLENAAESLYGGDEKSLAFAVKNSAFFAMSIMLAAKDMGLNADPMDGFDHAGVVEEFDIPDNYFVPLLIAIGHFDEKKEITPPKWRKKYDEIVIKEYR